MTSPRKDIWTWLLIAAVTVLIWYWAAGETRVTRTLHTRLEFIVAGEDPADWLIEPKSLAVAIEAEGSARAIRNAEETTKGRKLTIPLPATVSRQPVDITQALRDHPGIEETGITIVSTDPGSRELGVDEIVSLPARVLPLAGIEADDIVVEPPQVTVRMPSRLRRLYATELTVEPVVDRSTLDRLVPGARSTLENIELRLSAAQAPNSDVRIEPAMVKLTFTIRSRIREVKLEYPVRVLIAGPPEDHESVELEPKQLRDVTVIVPDELGRKIETGEAVVFAVVHLKSAEREARITSKPVTHFMALLPDDKAEFVRALIDGSETPPVIGLTITDQSVE